LTDRPSFTHASAPALAYDAEARAELEAAIAQNRRLMELARHNGFELDVREFSTGSGMQGTWWYVPVQFQRITGCMAARVQ
jgi:hypothetical protein